MGNAISSTATGFESVYYNPAGLAFDTAPSFAVGYQTAAFDLSINGEDLDTLSAPILNIGFAVPIPFGGALKDRIALGLGFAIPQNSILITDLEKPGEPTFVLVANRAQTVSIMASLAVRITDWLSIGGGIIALAELEGAIDVAPNEAGTLATSVRDELFASFAPILGAMIRPADGVALALTYRGESAARFDLPITADLGEAFTIPLPELTVQGVAQYDPAEVALEVSFHPIKPLLVSVAGVWQEWSGFELPVQYAAVPDNYPAQPSPNFSDTVSLRIGTELDLEIDNTWRVLPRAGYMWEPSPVPEQTGLHSYVDGERHVVTVGASIRWNDVRLDLFGQAHLIGEAVSTKTRGTSTLRGQGTVLVGGLEVGLIL